MKRYYKHIAVGIVLFLLFAGLLTNCMISNIKDTDSILHDDYQYLSLVHGAIAWETGVIRRLYDFGQIFPTYKEDKQGRKIIENYDNPDQTHKMIRLIHALFYRVPGSTGETDFGTTIQLADNDSVTTVKLIASIIVQCEQLQQQRAQFLGAIAYAQEVIQVIVDAGLLSKLDKKTMQIGLEQKIKEAQEKPWNAQAATAFVSMCKSFVQKLSTELGEDTVRKLNEHQQAAQKFFDLITDSTKNLRKLFKPEVFKKREPVESIIVQALNESSPQNPDSLYPPHTVEMILLAFVYKKYSYDRTILKAFYDELSARLGRKAFVYDLDEKWVKDGFAPVTQAQALKTIGGIFAEQDFLQSIKRHFAEFVYNAFQIRAFPAPVGYATSQYAYAKDKKTVGFSDCMCNAMRNFINLYSYDAEQNKFSLEKLLENMNISAVHSVLAKFLKDFNSVNVASSPNAHNAWLEVISNVPYVAYNQVVNGVTGQSTKALETGKGYMVIPEAEFNNELLVFLKNADYQVLENDQYGYELQPSIKNIIILLDHLLALNLFVSAGGLAKEFTRPDFIAIYFPRLYEALKATGFLSTQKNAQKSELNRNFDAFDYTQTKLYMTFNKASILCEFATSVSHGELKLIKGGVSEEFSNFALLLWKINDFTGESSLSLLVNNLLCWQQVNFDNLKNNLKYLYINLFAVPLENTGLLNEIIQGTFSIITDALPLKIKVAIKDLLLQLAERQPDAIQQQGSRFKVLELFVSKLSEKDVKNSTNILRDIITIAEKGSVDEKVYIKGLSLELFMELVRKNQAYAQAIEAAEKGALQGDNIRGRLALELFSELFKKNQAFKEATEVAELCLVLNGDNGLKLFKELFLKGQSFDDAIQFAVQGVTSEDVKIKLAAFDLFVALIEHNKAFTETTYAAQAGITDKNIQVRVAALNLFKALVRKNLELSAAVEAGKNGSIDTDVQVRVAALNLFVALVGKGKNMGERARIGISAIDVAQKSLTDLNPLVRAAALHLFATFVKNGHNIDLALNALQMGMLDKNNSVKQSTLDLLAALVEKDMEFENAVNAAAQGIFDPNLRKVAFDLFKILFKKKQGFKEAEQVALQGINNPDSVVRFWALRLCSALIEENQAIQSALQVAEKGIANQGIRDIEVESLALDLFKQLLIKAPDKTKTVIQKLLVDAHNNLTLDIKKQLVELLK